MIASVFVVVVLSLYWLATDIPFMSTPLPLFVHLLGATAIVESTRSISISHDSECFCDDCQQKYIQERRYKYEREKQKKELQLFRARVEDELKLQYQDSASDDSKLLGKQGKHSKFCHCVRCELESKGRIG